MRAAQVAILPIAAAMLTLVGCSAGPSHSEVAERFAIELAAGPGDATDWRDLADSLATDAGKGRCADDVYTSTLANEPALIYAWSATCLMYFEDQMSKAQQERARDEVTRAALAGLGG